MDALNHSCTVSIVIPAYNAQNTIHACLNSLETQSVPPMQVIIVDDCSSDETLSIAEKRRVEVVSFPERMGPAKARNAGAEHAKGEIIIFLDSDVTVPDDIVENIVAVFDNSPETLALQTVYSPRCPAKDIVSNYQNFYYFHALNRIDSPYVATFATWCAAVRRDTFLSIGGFNTRIPEPTVEDEELGYVIADRGGRILLRKDIRVTHLAAYSLKQFAKRRLRMARAQAKSGWRSFRFRMLRRYVNLRETGTHHSRWVVLSILLVMAAAVSLIAAAGMFLGGVADSWLPFAAPAVAVILALACHAGFFSSAARKFGFGILPGFAAMCILDMAILGWGILTGSFQYFTGKHY